MVREPQSCVVVALIPAGLSWQLGARLSTHRAYLSRYSGPLVQHRVLHRLRSLSIHSLKQRLTCAPPLPPSAGGYGRAVSEEAQRGKPAARATHVVRHRLTAAPSNAQSDVQRDSPEDCNQATLLRPRAAGNPPATQGAGATPSFIDRPATTDQPRTRPPPSVIRPRLCQQPGQQKPSIDRKSVV